MPFDTRNTALPLRPGTYKTRDGQIAVVTHVPPGIEGPMAVGYVASAWDATCIAGAADWCAATGQNCPHSGSSPNDLVGRVG